VTPNADNERTLQSLLLELDTYGSTEVEIKNHRDGSSVAWCSVKKDGKEIVFAQGTAIREVVEKALAQIDRSEP
jgi:hypothetical protein